eukprot:gene6108-8421_t
MSKEENIRVKFFTQFIEYRITEQPFVVPSKLSRFGLSEVINHLLGADEDTVDDDDEEELCRKVKHIPFDFMIDQQLVRMPLLKIVKGSAGKLSTEEIIEIEYFPAKSFSDENQESVELPAWVGCLTHNNNNIAAGCYDGIIRCFHTQSLSLLSETKAHDEPIRSITAWSSSSDNFIASSSKDMTVKCWSQESDSGRLDLITTLNGHINSVESICVFQSPSDAKNLLLSGDWSGNIIGWNVSDLAKPLNHEQELISSNTTSKKKRKNALGDANPVPKSNIEIQLKPLFTIKSHAQSVSSIYCHSIPGDSEAVNRMYTSSWDHSWKLWDLERQDCISTYAGAKVITSLDYSSVANCIVTSSADGKLRMWDARESTNTMVTSIFGKKTTWISQVKWQLGSSHIFSCVDYAGNVSLWDNRAIIPLSESEVHNGKALCLDWINNDNETAVVSGGSDCCIKSTHII